MSSSASSCRRNIKRLYVAQEFHSCFPIEVKLCFGRVASALKSNLRTHVIWASAASWMLQQVEQRCSCVLVYYSSCSAVVSLETEAERTRDFSDR